MNSDSHLDYFKYLKNRSKLGLAYRRYYLYPRISRYISGEALDVGCGIGDFIKYRKNSVGLDVNPYAVSYCNEHGVTAYLLDCDTFPFKDESFDSVVLDNVLEHLEYPESTLREIARILRIHGRLVIGVPGQKGYLSDPDHKKYYDAEKLIDLLECEKFTTESLFYTPFKSEWLNRNASQYCLYGVFSK